uniref:Cell wall and vascular inhibitor of beta-fructosidase n=1 Tax=Populus angustifolia TaxID=351344 RepID=A0A023INW3_9ROSI|nr:cell wall and vascular inhibitor of beta-fructosidase [Populus angustifolia]AGX27453.1 cell wall and vascular inhibitor of beta-fructosidase [Populus angustifolia]AGX27454.1 cell wall and vascular inhibitor of beta-fructosidase [Populus angustifolia]AGX27455.1 cell wall and vascular inhibitor of beta-fructosidase [Populus angustifolia]AGX27456.1 cell wall and vascular inhibitor of beta-fructosidase [Populus angustifolia]
MRTSVSSLSILLLYILLLSAPLPLTQCGDLVGQICKKTPFYDLCVLSLQPNSGTDVKTLASKMANLVLSNVTDTLSFIQGLVKQETGTSLERPLADCAELYIPVVKYNLPQAIDSLIRGRYGFANYVFSDVSKQADACEKNFSGEDESPLTDRNKLISNLCDVAVAIINILQKGF